MQEPTLIDDPDDRLQRVTVAVASEDALLDRAARTPTPTELVLAPVQLHARNLQRRLREAEAPRDGFAFSDPEAVGIDVLAAAPADRPTVSLDRVDRLSVIRSLLADPPASIREALGPTPAGQEQRVEQIRSEVEALTGFHPDRLAALRDAATDLDAPVDANATAVVDAALDAQRTLHERATRDPDEPKAVSDAALLRRATRLVSDTDGDAWRAAYPAVERVSLVGVSTVSAQQADLLAALLATTTVEVEFHLRPGTGPYLRDRLPALLSVEDPGREVVA